MQSLKFLNAKETKQIQEQLKNIYGFYGELDGVLLINNRQKLYLLSRGITQISSESEQELRIDKAGLYIATIMSNDEIRLSIEGCQIIGPKATKNILLIDEAHLEPWMKGEDFLLSDQEKKQTGENNGFFIIKFDKDFLGCGQLKNNNLRSLVSKERRLKVLNR
jgi:NOL1/NOP2/fmu family ribosome biogenesis protein